MDNKKLVGKIIKDLEENIYCRLKPSKINGVGVFAIKDIPKGTNIFKQTKKVKFIAVDQKLVFQNQKIDKEVKKMVKDFYTVVKGKIYLPNFSLNEIDISFFLNRSKSPNVVDEKGEEFFALRDIKKGEELTADYANYSDNFSKQDE